MNVTSGHLLRLADLKDADARAMADLGVSITLEANLAHLRSIKETELRWLDLLAIISLAGTGYLLSVSDENPLAGWAMAFPVMGYFATVVWIQFVLSKERLSYYSLLRSVVRGQNLLGLYDLNYLSPRLANSAFPKGSGPDPSVNGTQPFSSFLHRLVYTLVLLMTVVSAATFRAYGDAPYFWALSATLLGADIIWLLTIFRRDRSAMVNAWRSEQGLAGSDPDWFPSSRPGQMASTARAAIGPLNKFERLDKSPGSVLQTDDLGPLVERLREQGEKIVFTNGHFDLLHVGHLRCLEYARSLGSCLIAGLNSDATTSRLKGPRRPILPEQQRAEMIAALSSVDYVVVFGDDTAEEIVRLIKPDVYVKGGDYALTEEDEARGLAMLPERRIVEEYGGDVKVFPLVPGVSTSSIEASIRSGA